MECRIKNPIIRKSQNYKGGRKRGRENTSEIGFVRSDLTVEAEVGQSIGDGGRKIFRRMRNVQMRNDGKR
jgi:hypothetical protein